MPATSSTSPGAPPGSASADFAALALPWLPHVARLARALCRDQADADDLVQETFLRAHRYWHTFDPASDCRRWLSRICRNVLYDTRRRSRAETPVEDAELESLAAARLHVAAQAAGLGFMYDRVDLGPAIMSAFSRLDPLFRDVAVLSDIEGLSYQEIAQQLEVPLGTVRSRLYRARRQLQEMLMAYALDAGYGVNR